MSAAKRSRSIRALEEDEAVWVMLVSLKAGGVGLNLVRANHVVMTDIWWNPAVEEQALDRVHRIGQTREVTIHRLVVRDSGAEGAQAAGQEAQDCRGGARRQARQKEEERQSERQRPFGHGQRECEEHAAARQQV